MSIRVQCSNGHRLAAREEVAGKRIKCPKCGDIVLVPAPVVEEVIDLSMDDLIEEDPQAGVAENPTAESPLEPATDENLFDSLPEFPTDTKLTPAQQTPTAFVRAEATPQPAPAPRASANPITEASESERLTPGIIAAGIASLTSLILGLVVLSMLLIGRGDRSTQAAQAIPAESATAQDSPVDRDR